MKKDRGGELKAEGVGEEKGRGGGGFVHFSLSNACYFLVLGYIRIVNSYIDINSPASMLKLFDLDPRDPFV